MSVHSSSAVPETWGSYNLCEGALEAVLVAPGTILETVLSPFYVLLEMIWTKRLWFDCCVCVAVLLLDFVEIQCFPSLQKSWGHVTKMVHTAVVQFYPTLTSFCFSKTQSHCYPEQRVESKPWIREEGDHWRNWWVNFYESFLAVLGCYFRSLVLLWKPD